MAATGVPVVIGGTGVPVVITGITPGIPITIKVTSTAALDVENAGGSSYFTVDTSTPRITEAAPVVNSANNAASTPALYLSGLVFSGGSATTTKPKVLIETTATTSTAWSTSGTQLGVNASTGFVGNLIDLQLVAVSKFSVSSAGIVTAAGGINSSGGSDSTFQGRFIIANNAASTFVVGPNGLTNPTIKVNPAAVNTVTGLEVQGQAAGSGIVLAAISSVTDESIILTPKGAGTLKITPKIGSYNGVATAGWGVPAIQADTRALAQVAANASVATYTVGASDGSFEVSANVNVTVTSAENFNVQVDYTDETNTARTANLVFSGLTGTNLNVVNFANGAIPYAGQALQIRCKASTAITVKTAGTFTGCTYNVEGRITQVA